MLNLKPSSAGWDCISTLIVKESYSSFLMPLTHILHLSVMQGVFPNELKIARVNPLFKPAILWYSQITAQSRFCLCFQKYLSALCTLDY